MKKYRILISVISFCSLLACENNPVIFGDKAWVRMECSSQWTLGTDSLEFSFANYSSSCIDTVFDVSILVTGKAWGTDRTAEFEIDQARTTATGNQYEFAQRLVIPAGKYSAILPVTIRRDETLLAKTVKLYIKIKDNTDFTSGVNEQDHLLIKWSDVLSKPINWAALAEFFGEYSVTKHRFIIDVLNISSFNTDVLSWAQLKNYQIVLAEALRVYNESHPGNPLSDDNGILITF